MSITSQLKKKESGGKTSHKKKKNMEKLNQTAWMNKFTVQPEIQCSVQSLIPRLRAVSEI